MRFDYSAQPKKEVQSCNLCGGTRFAPVADGDRYGLPVKSVMCLGCWLVFLNPRMTADAYREFYRDGHYRKLLSEFYGREIDAKTIEAERQVYAKKVIRLLEPYLKARRVATMLNIGGSTGVVAEAVVKAFGCEGAIIESSEDEAQRALSRGLRVMLGAIEDHEPDGERFDLILLCQTIDHLLNIMDSLRTIRALLEDDGVLFVDVVWNTLIKVDHPYYLDDLTAPDYFRRVGFRQLGVDRDPDGTHLNYVLGKA